MCGASLHTQADGMESGPEMMGSREMDNSWLSPKPLGRWTKSYNHRDVTLRVETLLASGAQTAKRKVGAASKQCQQNPEWGLEDDRIQGKDQQDLV